MAEEQTVQNSDDPDAGRRSWGDSFTERAGAYVDENPIKAAVGLGVVTQQINKRVVDPLLDKGVGFVKGTAKKVFASGAEKKLNESMGGEAAANAVGGIVDLASTVVKAFAGVSD